MGSKLVGWGRKSWPGTCRQNNCEPFIPWDFWQQQLAKDQNGSWFSRLLQDKRCWQRTLEVKSKIWSDVASGPVCNGKLWLIPLQAGSLKAVPLRTLTGGQTSWGASWKDLQFHGWSEWCLALVTQSNGLPGEITLPCSARFITLPHLAFIEL